MKGGKVITSGTYGCILNPALPCEGEKTRPKNRVSKLMTSINAETEMNEIKDISLLTKKIPNHNKYFILNQIKMQKSHARQIKNAVKTIVQVPISNYIVKNRNIDKISIKVVDKSLEFAKIAT